MDPKIILWDIDGVLIKVSESYRRAIIESVQYYFSEAAGLDLKEYLVDAADTQDFKMAGGFNDDWDLTYAAVLCCLSKLLDCASFDGLDLSGRPGSLDSMVERLRELGSFGLSPEKADFPRILVKAKGLGGGLSGVEKALPGFFKSGFARAQDFFFPELIKRVFEEFYLGKKLFAKKYGEEARFYSGEGFIAREEALIGLDLLLNLRQKYYFGIVTGRERFETEYSLKKTGLYRIFPSEVIVTREDTEEGKPSPEPLMEGKMRVCEKYRLPQSSEVIYMGDSVDDLSAARNAGFYFIAIVGGIGGPDEVNKLRLELHDRICDLIVDEAEELFLYL